MEIKDKKVVIITGASSGIGKATAEKFVSKNFDVYGLARKPFSVNGVTTILCDVEKNEDVTRAVNEIFAKTGKIDILINNAGMGISGSIEFSSLENIEKQMNINFMGAVRMTKAVLPIMRKQGFGRIINITSPAGAIFPMPYQAFYATSKAALENFTQSLRIEVKPFKIKVCSVVPGDTKTGFTSARIKNTNDSESVYKNENISVSRMEKYEQKGIAPSKVANVIYKSATRKNPPPMVLVGFAYKLYNLANKLLPKRFIYWILPKLY